MLLKSGERVPELFFKLQPTWKLQVPMRFSVRFPVRAGFGLKGTHMHLPSFLCGCGGQNHSGNHLHKCEPGLKVQLSHTCTAHHDIIGPAVQAAKTDRTQKEAQEKMEAFLTSASSGCTVVRGKRLTGKFAMCQYAVHTGTSQAPGAA